MKQLIFLLALASITFTACQEAGEPEEHGTLAEGEMLPTSIEFEEYVYDFGTIEEGDKVHKIFFFTNEGKNPLLIQDATAQCGCTEPIYPKEPIEPGERGKIDVTFNSKNKTGVINKNVTVVTANTTPKTIVLKLKGEVKPK